MKPRVSIIIPCYNQGILLQDALKSIQNLDSSLAEIIIVNDGSTDFQTNQILQGLGKVWKVVHQSNQGLPAARNTAIRIAKGDYILPMDSDNMVEKTYITECIEILDNNPEISVVYSDAFFFGEKNGLWNVGEFNMQKLMMANYIDACAVIRANTLREVGLYDINMKHGWEDWDLWLRIAFKGLKFHYIPRPLFHYRVSSISMSRILYSDYKIPNSIEDYIHSKYPSRMGHNFIVDFFVTRFKKNPVKFFVKLIIRTYFFKYYNKRVREGKFRNGL